MPGSDDDLFAHVRSEPVVAPPCAVGVDAVGLAKVTRCCCSYLELEMISSGLGLPCAPTLHCRRLATNMSSGISESSITTWDDVPPPGWTS